MSASLPTPLLCGFAFSLIALGISTEVSAKDKQADSEATAENLFAREIAPVLVTRCLGCHGDKDPDGNYSLSDTIKLLKAGDTEKSPITPGDPEQSELFKRITSEDEDLRMPPEGPRLNASQVAVVKQWIIEGAKLPQGDAATAVPLVSMLPTQVQGVTPEHYPKPIPIRAVAISADGQRVYAAGYGEVTVWSTAAGQLLMRIPVAGIQIADIELTSSSNLLAVSSGTPGEIGVVQLIDATNGKPAGDVWRGNDLPADVAFSHQGDRLLVGLMDGSLHMYRTEDRQPIYQLTPHADAILAVAWSPDDERIVTCARDRTAKHYNAADGQLLSSYDRHERAVGGVAYTSAGPFSLDETGLLRLWNKDNDSAIAENGGNLRFLQHLTTVEDRLIVPALGSLRKLQIIRKEIDDGKDDKGEPKKKKVTRFEGLGSLASQDPQSFILSVSANQHGDIVAGTDLGQVIYWKIDSEQPISAFLAKP